MTKRIARDELLNQDLIDYDPQQWKFHNPFRSFRFRSEDIVPALSGAIGKVSLVSAFALAWAHGFGITDPTFVTENVRLEIVLASLFTLVFCVLLNPSVGPPGTLAPLIPLIPIMIAAGVHPLPLSLLIGGLGLLISILGYFNIVLQINGPGTKGGIMLLFGVMGIISSLEKLQIWSAQGSHDSLLLVLLLLAIGIYILLSRLNARWLIIPACAVLALLVSALYGLSPDFQTPIALPIVNPSYWWNVRWGIGFGLTGRNFLTALPFAMLVIAMWPIDALAVRSIQETNYPVQAQRAYFNMNATFLVASLRNAVGAVLGGSQIAAIWRSFMIPLGVVKRPIGGSALLLAGLGLAFGILGFPIDISTFPALVWLVLIFGVFIPLIEIGLAYLRGPATIPVAVICLLLGAGLNPVLGWGAALFTENFNLLAGPNDKRDLAAKDKILTVIILLVAVISYLFIM